MTRLQTSLLQKAILPAAVLLLAACSNGADAPASAGTVEAKPAETAVQGEVMTVSLDDVINHPRRADDAPRDQYRNPKPTLEFFEVGPGQTVAEIWPGWYTPILAPYMAANDGEYIAVIYPDGLSERVDARNAAFKERFGDTDEFGEIGYASYAGDAGLSLDDNSVDTILTFRNVHNWMGGGYADQTFKDFYRALKPGGILGVVEHRLPETQTQNPRGNTGYVQESYMKALAEDAGFEFVAASEVNANPDDTADHPFGVWTLPPRSRLPEEGSEQANGFDAELYRNIGESDRATLKFRKPG